eukprot:TRINITY_DN297_c0_g1_i14.p1 TRINITY_DN297_c0_g1~~TRINITY_DN297_c0_g1_i14.p1  ORF type:complete len:286 (+),score=59.27 TRINITY_DN297_c0_g1_i14:31-858(+)
MATTTTTTSATAKTAATVAQGSDSITHNGWRMTSAKRPIASMAELDILNSEVGSPLPEMVFPNNHVTFEHLASGVQFSFNTRDALDACRDEPGVRVRGSSTWDKHGVQVQGKGTLDWTFSTTSRGTIRSNSTAATTTDAPLIRPTTTEIPLEELKRRDPILCYADVHLYEDELHDNGIALLNVKARLMPTCIFALQRFWLRVDGVEMRVRDVRLFHRFGSAVVLREYVTRAVGFEQLAALGLPIMSAELTEPAVFVDKMPVVSRVLEEIVLPDTV